MAQADAGAGGLLEPSSSAGTVAARGGSELRRWRALCGAVEGVDRHPWPEIEARALVDAVLRSVLHGDEHDLDAASAAWASVTASMPVLVRRLGCLRELLAEEGLASGGAVAERLQRVLDKVTTTATETALAELEDAALTDALTGAGNRRALESAARAALAAAARTNTPLSLAVIDLDGLKTINDTEGHAAGDKVLGGLSTALRAALRETDQLFRVGGDEFVVLLPLAPPDAVVHLMQRAEHFRAPSFSWGVASAPTDATELADLLQIADARLYAARRAAGYYDGRSSSAGAPAPAPPVTTPPPPAPVHRHRARTLVLAGALSVGGVVGFVLMLPGAPKASSTNPPPPGQLPPSGAANGPGASGPAAGPGPSGATLSGPSGAGTSSPTGTSGTSATGSSPAPSGTTTPGSGGGGPSGPSTTTSSTTTTAPSGGPQQPGITLPPPPIGTSGLNTGTGL